MPTVDYRTKRDDEVVEVDLPTWRDDALPGLLERNGNLAARGMTARGFRPMALEVDGTVITLAVDGERLVALDRPTDDAFVVELDRVGFSDLVNELRTATAFLTAGATPVRNGSIFDFVFWDPILRALIDGRPVHEPGMIDFVDRHGAPLDLERSFGPDDDVEEMQHFIREAGFLHLGGWLDPADMAVIADDIDRALPTYERDDGKSWWARTADGTDRCVRLQEFIDHSPTTRTILGSDGFRRVGDIPGAGHEQREMNARVIEALVKPIGIVEGISDVPWHKDCSLGRHSYNCCGMTIGISVTGSDADGGQLQVLAGSHRANIATALTTDGTGLPIVPLPTDAGDLTVHLSCTMHMAMPPRTTERKVMYTGFGLPSLSGGPRQAGDRISAVRENAYKTVSQMPGHTG